MKRITCVVIIGSLFTSCSYTAYEYIHNKSGNDISVTISPAIPDTIARVKANNFERQGVTASKDNSGSCTYVIRNKGWLKVGQAYDALGKDDLLFDNMVITRGPNDTMTYEGKHDIINAFKKQSFTKYVFVKEEKKGDKKSSSEKIGGWVHIVKKTPVN